MTAALALSRVVTTLKGLGKQKEAIQQKLGVLLKDPCGCYSMPAPNNTSSGIMLSVAFFWWRAEIAKVSSPSHGALWRALAGARTGRAWQILAAPDSVRPLTRLGLSLELNTCLPEDSRDMGPPMFPEDSKKASPCPVPYDMLSGFPHARCPLSPTPWPVVFAVSTEISVPTPGARTKMFGVQPILGSG